MVCDLCGDRLREEVAPDSVRVGQLIEVEISEGYRRFIPVRDVVANPEHQTLTFRVKIDRKPVHVVVGGSDVVVVRQCRCFVSSDGSPWDD